MHYSETCPNGHYVCSLEAAESGPVATNVSVNGRPGLFDEYRCNKEACGLPVYFPAMDETVETLFEVRPCKHSMAEETSTFLVRDTRREVERLEEELGETNWVGQYRAGFYTCAEARKEYDYLFEEDEVERMLAADV